MSKLTRKKPEVSWNLELEVQVTFFSSGSRVQRAGHARTFTPRSRSVLIFWSDFLSHWVSQLSTGMILIWQSPQSSSGLALLIATRSPSLIWFTTIPSSSRSPTCTCCFRPPRAGRCNIIHVNWSVVTCLLITLFPHQVFSVRGPMSAWPLIFARSDFCVTVTRCHPAGYW